MMGSARALRPRALALTGPTTSGKTDLSLALARALGGEIVSMDSRQVYRGMDIGTDKVMPAERGEVPHFGLDLVDPDETYSAGQWARDVRRWIPDIEGRGHVPILVGGTGFFLRAVLEPVFREPDLDPERRAALRAWMAHQPSERLGAWVERLDPQRAALAREGGRQRMARTLEVALLTGVPLSRWHSLAAPDGPAIPSLVVLLELDRDELDRRIDARVQRMVERGFVDEVQALLDAGHDRTSPGMTGTGYREVAASLAGEMSLDDALEAMRLQTRQYARRQLTWFRNQLPADTLRVDARLPLDEKVRMITDAWTRARAIGGGA